MGFERSRSSKIGMSTCQSWTFLMILVMDYWILLPSCLSIVQDRHFNISILDGSICLIISLAPPITLSLIFKSFFFLVLFVLSDISIELRRFISTSYHVYWVYLFFFFPRSSAVPSESVVAASLRLSSPPVDHSPEEFQNLNGLSLEEEELLAPSLKVSPSLSVCGNIHQAQYFPFWTDVLKCGQWHRNILLKASSWISSTVSFLHLMMNRIIWALVGNPPSLGTLWILWHHWVSSTTSWQNQLVSILWQLLPANLTQGQENCVFAGMAHDGSIPNSRRCLSNWHTFS